MTENVASFLPPYVKTKANWISEDNYHLTVRDEAFIICVFSVAEIIFAPFNSRIKYALGQKNIITLGFILLAATSLGFGYIANFDNPRVFRNLAIILRFIQGIGTIAIEITCFSISTSIYPK